MGKTVEDLADAIIEVVAAEHFITAERIKGKRRLPRIVEARHAAMYLLRHQLGMSFPEIGRHMNRDHSSVVYAVHKLERQYEEIALAEREVL